MLQDTQTDRLIESGRPNRARPSAIRYIDTWTTGFNQLGAVPSKASPDFKNLSPEGLAILLANLSDVMTRYKERRLDQ